MPRDRTMDELWETAPRTTARFDPAHTTHLPEPARRYLAHTLAPGAPLAHAARIEMHGTIRLAGAWHPFEATQVLRWDRGFVWRARTRMKGLPVSGSDRLVDGEGAMRWKMLGVIPVATASGPEVSRSAAGRFHAEVVWMPGVLLDPEVQWSAPDPAHATYSVRAHGEGSEVELALAESGALRSLVFPRWGDLGTGTFRSERFGGEVLAERTWGGVTIPSELRLGWYYGTDRFEPEGEFFRCTIDAVEHR